MNRIFRTNVYIRHIYTTSVLYDSDRYAPILKKKKKYRNSYNHKNIIQFEKEHKIDILWPIKHYDNNKYGKYN